MHEKVLRLLARQRGLPHLERIVGHGVHIRNDIRNGCTPRIVPERHKADTQSRMGIVDNLPVHGGDNRVAFRNPVQTDSRSRIADRTGIQRTHPKGIIAGGNFSAIIQIASRFDEIVLDAQRKIVPPFGFNTGILFDRKPIKCRIASLRNTMNRNTD